MSLTIELAADAFFGDKKAQDKGYKYDDWHRFDKIKITWNEAYTIYYFSKRSSNELLGFVELHKDGTIRVTVV